jgi:hypothetical protein
MSAAFSATAITVALVFPRATLGMTEASNQSHADLQHRALSAPNQRCGQCCRCWSDDTRCPPAPVCGTGCQRDDPIPPLRARLASRQQGWAVLRYRVIRTSLQSSSPCLRTWLDRQAWPSLGVSKFAVFPWQTEFAGGRSPVTKRHFGISLRKRNQQLPTPLWPFWLAAVVVLTVFVVAAVVVVTRPRPLSMPDGLHRAHRAENQSIAMLSASAIFSGPVALIY